MEMLHNVGIARATEDEIQVTHTDPMDIIPTIVHLCSLDNLDASSLSSCPLNLTKYLSSLSRSSDWDSCLVLSEIDDS